MESFLYKAVFNKLNHSLADNIIKIQELRKGEQHTLIEFSISNTAKSSTVIIKPTSTLERSNPPQAPILVILREHRFSDSYEHSIINEHPEAL